MIAKLTAWLASMPSTNTRIAVTLALYLATAVRYLGWGVPNGLQGDARVNAWDSWLLLIAAMAGIDAAQFWAKRATQSPPPTTGTP